MDDNSTINLTQSSVFRVGMVMVAFVPLPSDIPMGRKTIFQQNSQMHQVPGHKSGI
jgi:hypothetical protein